MRPLGPLLLSKRLGRLSSDSSNRRRRRVFLRCSPRASAADAAVLVVDITAAAVIGQRMDWFGHATLGFHRFLQRRRRRSGVMRHHVHGIHVRRRRRVLGIVRVGRRV